MPKPYWHRRQSAAIGGETPASGYIKADEKGDIHIFDLEPGI